MIDQFEADMQFYLDIFYPVIWTGVFWDLSRVLFTKNNIPIEMVWTHSNMKSLKIPNLKFKLIANLALTFLKAKNNSTKWVGTKCHGLSNFHFFHTFGTVCYINNLYFLNVEHLPSLSLKVVDSIRYLWAVIFLHIL